ncbi:MAG: tetratricopeptide repeat protein [Bacteroidales bacterium]|jgi:tetratricopeptide (TPR) repeat protein|nr:tetratricopeptide repeat protein [Bacteroidales bacterium]
MNKVKYYIGLLFIVSQLVLWAQKKEPVQRKTEDIPPAMRAQSALFADGLREFYTDSYQAAEHIFRQVLFQNAKNSAAQYMLGKIRAQVKDYSGAAYYFDEAVKIDKNNVWYKAERAKNLVNLGDYNAAAQAWEEVCKLEPKNEVFLYNLSDCYVNLGKYQEVIKVYNRMEKLVGPNEELTRAKRNIYLYFNDLKSAVGEYDKLIKENPGNLDFYVAAGDIYMSNNVPDKALPYYEKVLQIEPNHPQANLSIASYWLLQGDADQSFKSYLLAFESKELEKEAKLPVLRSYLAQAIRSRNSADIQRTAQLAAALTEANSNAVEGPATQGSLCLFQADYSNAKDFFAQALAIDNTQYSLWQDYFSALERLGDYPAITERAEEAAELYPTNAVLLYTIANAYLKNGQLNEALDWFKPAATFAFDSDLLGSIYFRMAEIYSDMHNPDEAEKYYKMAEAKGKRRDSR